MDTTAAYRECERITWSQARNFAYGIRLLPAGKRQGLAAIYAFARRIDDIGDGTMPATDKLAALEAARAATLTLAGAAQALHPQEASQAPQAMQAMASPDDPVLIALTDVAKSFPVPMAAFGELIDGCVADVNGTRYQTFDDLLHYCRCVAGSIGRLSLGIFGTADPTRAARLADSLGVALQLTNILRDIREDYQQGRVYLPAEDLAKFGCTLQPGQTLQPGRQGKEPAPDATTQAQLVQVIEFEAQRAKEWYAIGMQLLPLLDRRSAACTGAMAGIYRRLLDRIAANPAAVLSGRLSLSPGEKALVAAQSLAGMTRRRTPAAPAPSSGGAS
jgi:phytoene synthase